MIFRLIEEYKADVDLIFNDYEIYIKIEFTNFLDNIIEKNIKKAEIIFKGDSYIRIRKSISECYETKICNGDVMFKLKDEYKEGIEIPLSDDDYTTSIFTCPKCGTPYILDDLLKLKEKYNKIGIACKKCLHEFNKEDIIKREITPGRYRHFKGKNYEVIGIAKNATNNENLNDMVVYRALYGDYQLYYRDIIEFSSKVNKNKYPEATQEFRFERIDE